MEPVAFRILYFAVLAAWFAVSSATAAEKPQYGGFSSDADSLQPFYDYIHGQEMIKVEAGDELRSAIDSIPVDLGTAIDSEQEAGLRDWLYDLLVAFSASGNDSLAAAFYLREGFNNPDLAAQMIQEVERRGLSIGDTDTPFAFCKSMHKFALNFLSERDYFFENVSFFDSVFKVFEMQGAYDSYESYLETHGMIPRGIDFFDLIKMREEVEERLQKGAQLVFVDVMFIVEEPEQFSTFEGPGRTPSFFRLAWDPDKAIWRHVEIYFSQGVPQDFLFNIM